MKKSGYSLAVVGLFALALSIGLGGCGDDEPGGGSSTTVGVSTTAGPTTTAEGPAVITVQEALSAQGPVRVVGAIIATYPDDGATAGGADPGEPTIVLTTAMAESYPPQPGGPTIAVTGLDLDDLVGLSTTVGEAEVAPATWTNYWLVLEGTVSDGTLEVTATPAVIQAITPELLIRFSVATEPLRLGRLGMVRLRREEQERGVSRPHLLQRTGGGGGPEPGWSGEVSLERRPAFHRSHQDSRPAGPGRYIP